MKYVIVLVMAILIPVLVNFPAVVAAYRRGQKEKRAFARRKP